MAQDNAASERTDRARGQDIVLFLYRENLATNNPDRAPPEDATKIFRLLAVLSR